MSKDVRREIGYKLGSVIEVDKRSWQANQAKFIRVRVNLPIDKSLRKGGNIAIVDGDRFWVSFRYERLPTFYYVCGKIGHDEKHCSVKQDGQQVDRQYREWLRASSTNKGGFEHTRSTSSKSQESTDEENIRRS
ncbi:hypothetical protein SO802_028842 [Lithocarpus litseifolius]|uniref:Zinc knuckle CX2CX4HX4C domain-containing protein n=1 Tax=Lithocarpus litseifolius TaxID=425828 RepID=A0AAW2BSZ1_9ROSI